MPKLTTVLEDSVRYRDGKKWKRRYCMLTKPDPKTGNVTMYITKQYNRGNGGVTEIDEKNYRHYLIEEITGFEYGRHMDRESSVMALIGLTVVHCIAFSQTDTMFRWAETLNKIMKPNHFHVTFKQVSESSGLFHKVSTSLQGNLHVQSHRMCLIGEPADGNKFICEWPLENLLSVDIFDSTQDKISILQIKSNNKVHKVKGSFEFEISYNQKSQFKDVFDKILHTCLVLNPDFKTNFINKRYSADVTVINSASCGSTQAKDINLSTSEHKSGGQEMRSSEIPIPSRSREHSGEEVHLKIRNLTNKKLHESHNRGATDIEDDITRTEAGYLFPADDEIQDEDIANDNINQHRTSALSMMTVKNDDKNGNGEGGDHLNISRQHHPLQGAVDGNATTVLKSNCNTVAAANTTAEIECEFYNNHGLYNNSILLAEEGLNNESIKTTANECRPSESSSLSSSSHHNQSLTTSSVTRLSTSTNHEYLNLSPFSSGSRHQKINSLPRNSEIISIANKHHQHHQLHQYKVINPDNIAQSNSNISNLHSNVFVAFYHSVVRNPLSMINYRNYLHLFKTLLPYKRKRSRNIVSLNGRCFLRSNSFNCCYIGGEYHNKPDQTVPTNTKVGSNQRSSLIEPLTINCEENICANSYDKQHRYNIQNSFKTNNLPFLNVNDLYSRLKQSQRNGNFCFSLYCYNQFLMMLKDIHILSSFVPESEYKLYDNGALSNNIQIKTQLLNSWLERINGFISRPPEWGKKLETWWGDSTSLTDCNLILLFEIIIQSGMRMSSSSSRTDCCFPHTRGDDNGQGISGNCYCSSCTSSNFSGGSCGAASCGSQQQKNNLLINSGSIPEFRKISPSNTSNSSQITATSTTSRTTSANVSTAPNTGTYVNIFERADTDSPLENNLLLYQNISSTLNTDINSNSFVKNPPSSAISVSTTNCPAGEVSIGSSSSGSAAATTTGICKSKLIGHHSNNCHCNKSSIGINTASAAIATTTTTTTTTATGSGGFFSAFSMSNKDSSFKRLRRKCSPSLLFPFFGSGSLKLQNNPIFTRQKTPSTHSTLSEPSCNQTSDTSKEQNLYYNLAQVKNKGFCKRSLSVVLDNNYPYEDLHSNNRRIGAQDYINIENDLDAVLRISCKPSDSPPEEIKNRHSSNCSSASNYYRSNKSILEDEDHYNKISLPVEVLDPSRNYGNIITASSKILVRQDSSGPLTDDNYLATGNHGNSWLRVGGTLPSNSSSKNNYFNYYNKPPPHPPPSPISPSTKAPLNYLSLHNMPGQNQLFSSSSRDTDSVIEYCNIDVTGTYALRKIDRMLSGNNSPPNHMYNNADSSGSFLDDGTSDFCQSVGLDEEDSPCSGTGSILRSQNNHCHHHNHGSSTSSLPSSSSSNQRERKLYKSRKHIKRFFTFRNTNNTYNNSSNQQHHVNSYDK